jgi:hypothetical protein
MNIGERVGDYEIVEILGAGGMGQVYKVRNMISNRIEAMKILLPGAGADQSLADRFLREIQVQATLDHPNIARLHTAHLMGNQLIMIMEYVEGSTIEKLLEHGTLSVRESVQYAQQVLSALSYAHARGVVHRDIKPANIMRMPDGTVKLMDFGIARMQQDRKLTQTGSTVGSLFYMSPEQIRGSQPDPRSDLYSLGITLYEMVTGRRPFEGNSDFTIMAAHLQQSPLAPIDVVPGVPQPVNDIILMAIAKDPAERFQSAEAFRAALDSLGMGAPVTAAVVDHTVARPNMPPAGPPAAPAPFTPASAPPPAYAPPQAYTPPAYSPAPPPVRPPASRRGLYMTLGSIATIGVIALGIFAAPRFFRTGANSGTAIQQSTPAAADPSSPATAGGTIPGSPDAVSAEPASAHADVPAVPSQAAPPPFVQQPVQPARTAQQPSQPSQPQRPSSQQQVPPPAAAQPPVQAVPQPAPAPARPVNAQNAPGSPAASPVTPAQASQPVVTGAPAANSAELEALREDYNLMAVRVATAKSGLRNIEQQMRRQGLDLRGDMIEAESRMDLQMKEAMDSIRAGNAAPARRQLRLAENALEQIEKFLGR